MALNALGTLHSLSLALNALGTLHSLSLTIHSLRTLNSLGLALGPLRALNALSLTLSPLRPFGPNLVGSAITLGRSTAIVVVAIPALAAGRGCNRQRGDAGGEK